jgi:polyisoprenoid-binding protein YceI
VTALPAVVAAGTWTVDPTTTRAQFRARDVFRRPVVGTLPVRVGRVEVATDGTPVEVVAELDLAGVATGIGRRDRDLLGRSFFDVRSSPVLRFAGGPARLDGEGRWLLAGTLALRGVECQVELAVELVGRGDGAARVRATTSLDRRDVGIRVPRLLVGHDVGVVVEAELVPPE